jgi:cytoskeletal protein CcmA (bactofilin family)
VFNVTQAGNVGIGTTSPSTKLHVAGDGTITGNLTVTGNIAAKYQDVAEWVESSQALAAGTVVILDHTKSNQVIASSQAYDTRVAGVISSQPGITLGENGAGKVLVATTGRVKVKVDASAGPIQVGDLLVTSEKEGVAKKSEPLNLGGVQIHRPGTLIGKALEPLAKGTGEILVLLSLQ